MADLNSTNLVLTGVPRGGTTLACQLLQQCHDTVALFEPMDVAALPLNRAAAVHEVQRFFTTCREQLLADGCALSKQAGGVIPDNPFSDVVGADGQRELLVTRGRICIDPPPPPDFTLVIKHNAAFAALLPELSAQLRTVAIVRHPLSVLASWNSVDLPVRAGRIPAGERLDRELTARLDHEPDRIARQLLVLEWFFARFDRRLPMGSVLRYEDMIATQGEQLHTLAGVRGNAVNALTERNANRLYARTLIPQLATALIGRPGSWQRWYPLGSIAPLAQRMLGTGEGT